MICIINIGNFSSIAFGLMIFGWYVYKGEYDQLPESSEELKHMRAGKIWIAPSISFLSTN